MIDARRLRKLHEGIMRRLRGDSYLPGLVNAGGLESAAAAPFRSIYGVDLWPGVHAKAAVLARSILANHPFVEGNARVAYEACRLFLRLSGKKLSPPPREVFEALELLREGSVKAVQAFANWLSEHTSSVP